MCLFFLKDFKGESKLSSAEKCITNHSFLFPDAMLSEIRTSLVTDSKIGKQKAVKLVLFKILLNCL